MRLELLDTRRLWDRAPHCAFTDLVWFQGRLLCAFRESADHHAFDGTVRILESRDGGFSFSSCAELRLPGEDLRDPRFLALGNDRLFLLCGARTPVPDRERDVVPVRTLLYASPDGCRWTAPQALVGPQFWLWRLTLSPWGLALGVAYHAAEPVTARLYGSGDLRSFDVLVPTLFSEGRPSEHALAFRPDGEALCLLRRDPGSALLGRAKPPYRSWSWTDLGVRIGGPCLVDVDGALVAGVRLHQPQVHTALCLLDPDARTLTETLALPSGEDTSYPGMVRRGADLWVSYYSSHEGPTAVYLARVRLSAS